MGKVDLKTKRKRCLVCKGCQARFCSICSYCQIGKMDLCQIRKSCLNPIFEPVQPPSCIQGSSKQQASQKLVTSETPLSKPNVLNPDEHNYSKLVKSVQAQAANSMTSLIRKSENYLDISTKSGKNSQQQVISSNVSKVSQTLKKRKMTKQVTRKIVCEDCPGCQIPFCGSCYSCKSGRSYLCYAKQCSNPRWNTVPVKKWRMDDTPEPDVRSSIRVFLGITYDFRCTICGKIPRKANRSELYRHYSLEHFNAELMNEFGHLEVCPLCDLFLAGGKGKNASHFGQKHDMVEKFLPVEARIPKSLKGVIGGEVGTSIIKSSNKILMDCVEEDALPEFWIWPEVPQDFEIEGESRRVRCFKEELEVTKIDGFEIEIVKEKDEDVNDNYPEELLFLPPMKSLDTPKAKGCVDQTPDIVRSSLTSILNKNDNLNRGDLYLYEYESRTARSLSSGLSSMDDENFHRNIIEIIDQSKYIDQNISDVRSVTLRTVENNKVFCEVCDKFIKKKRWYEHKNTVHSTTSFTCSICPNKTFKARAYWRHHMRRIHRPDQQCSMDEEVFGLKVNLEGKTNRPCRQQKNASNQDGDNENGDIEVNGELFDCNSCTRIFQSVTNLRSHEQTVHRTEAVLCS